MTTLIAYRGGGRMVLGSDRQTTYGSFKTEALHPHGKWLKCSKGLPAALAMVGNIWWHAAARRWLSQRAGFVGLLADDVHAWLHAMAGLAGKPREEPGDPSVWGVEGILILRDRVWSISCDLEMNEVHGPIWCCGSGERAAWGAWHGLRHAKLTHHLSDVGLVATMLAAARATDAQTGKPCIEVLTARPRRGPLPEEIIEKAALEAEQQEAADP